MTKHRVAAPQLNFGEKTKGLATHFPSIEKKYGETIQLRLDYARSLLVCQLDTLA